MKKNITINLFGQLYNIDEDAYELISKYQENIRRYFARHEGGEEVIDDVEHRIAELFAELKASGVEAVTIEHVKDIVARIGDPQQMEEDEEGNTQTTGATPPPFQQPMVHRRLYRNPDDKILGGVISGLTVYFGLRDPLVWRLILVLLFFVSFFTVFIIYIVLWILVPEAQTADQRLAMRGKPITMNNLRDEMMRDLGSKDILDNVASKGEGFLRILLYLVIYATSALITLISGAVFIISMGALISLLTNAFNITTPFPDLSFMGISNGVPIVTHSFYYMFIWFFTISTLLLSAFTIYLIVRYVFMRTKKESMTIRKKGLLLGIWLGLLFIILLSGFFVDSIYDIQEEKRIEQICLKSNTDNFNLIQQGVFDQLAIAGWNKASLYNVTSEDFTHISDYDNDGETKHFYEFSISRDNSNLKWSYDISSTEYLKPGTYNYKFFYNSRGLGNFLYLNINHKEIKKIDLGDNTLVNDSVITIKNVVDSLIEPQLIDILDSSLKVVNIRFTLKEPQEVQLRLTNKLDGKQQTNIDNIFTISKLTKEKEE